MNSLSNTHTFAICAYQETRFLDDCIKSLLAQSVQTKIIICTSTPNGYIEGKAKEYKIELFINKGESGLASDWNFAAKCVDTPYYTLCHQDDYYFKDYAKAVLEAIARTKNLIFIYTNYYEDKGGVIDKSNINLKIKKFMNLPMSALSLGKRKWIRRRVLSLGNPVCCPSVTFNKVMVKDDLFNNTFKNAADWDAWERLSKLKGEVLYIRMSLMAHRVHDESTTSLNIQNNIRKEEDLIMFQRFWPKFIAKFLTSVFGLSEKNNG